jgi:hypothetical protein
MVLETKLSSTVASTMAENPTTRMVRFRREASGVGGLQRHEDVTFNVGGRISCNKAVAAW